MKSKCPQCKSDNRKLLSYERKHDKIQNKWECADCKHVFVVLVPKEQIAF